MDIQPVPTEAYTYLAITNSGEVVEINTDRESARPVYSIGGSGIDLDHNISLRISPDRNLVAIFQTYGRFGLVIDLDARKVTMKLERDDDYSDLTTFPLAFFRHEHQIFLVHGTKWNRLDISDPWTGKLLTHRDDPAFRLVGNRPETDEHYVDFFHGKLLVSPDHEWIVDQGWEWHPLGSVTSWNIKSWLLSNKWESEDGPTKKILWWGKEDWNDPMCWISNTEVGISGISNPTLCGEEDRTSLSTERRFRIFNVMDGTLVKQFEIAEGALFFDQVLFCSSRERGLRIYDVTQGAVLFEDPTIKPKTYHKLSKEFVDYDYNEIRIYRLSRDG